jgi:hypothetical protein
MSRGLKRSHHGPSTGNGNINLIELNPDSNPDTYVQHRERARSPGSQLPSPTTANPNGQANQNSVLQTTNQTLAQSEFARLHQQMIQERRQQQQLAREEAAKLKERVKTALAKAIGWAIAASCAYNWWTTGRWLPGSCLNQAWLSCGPATTRRRQSCRPPTTRGRQSCRPPTTRRR